MSLGCFECRKIGGAYGTLILYSKDGKFDMSKPLSHYDNFYTCCAYESDFKELKRSKFAIVEQGYAEDSYLTGHDGPLLKDVAVFKKVSEKELMKSVPKIVKALKK